MNAHSEIYSHTTEQNETRSNNVPQLSSRFWGKCARMLSVIAISAVATGSAFSITITGDTNPQVDATFAGTAYTTARVSGVDGQPLVFPVPTNVLGTVHYSIDGSSLTTAKGGSITGAAKYESTPQSGASSSFISTNAPTEGSLTYAPAAGFYGQDIIPYRVYDVSSTGGTSLTVATGTLTINVAPALIEAPATTTTTTINALTGAGVMLVTGTGTPGQAPGTVSLVGDVTANAGFTGGVSVDGGSLSLGANFAVSGGLSIAAKHGAKVTSSGNFTFSKVILA
ncbi:MAG: hypothetical protein V4544_00015 [Pseudomonadota bacterium]